MKTDSFRYSPIIKTLCFVLSVIMFAMFAFNSVYALIPLDYFSPDEVLSDSRPDFYNSDYAAGVFNLEIYNLNLICGKSAEEKETELKNQKDKQVEAALKAFKKSKADIIHDELVYVAENNEDYNSDNAGGLTESYIDSIPDTPEKDRKYVIDPYLAPGVRVARKVLNYAEGDEFLKYENLIRREAFNQEFSYQFKYLNEVSLTLYLSEKEAKKQLSSSYDAFVKETVQSYSNEYATALRETGNLVNIKYYIKSGDKVLTNMSDAKKERSAVSEYGLFITKSDGRNIEYGGSQQSRNNFDDIYNNNEWAKTTFENCSEVTVYMINEKDFTGDDYVIRQYNLFNQMNYSIKPYITKAVIFFIISVSALIIMLNLSGHKRGLEGITLSFIDSVPGDVHLLASLSAVGFFIWLFVELAGELFYIENMFVISSLIQPIVLLVSVAWMIFIEWLASVVRTVKSERKYWRNFITVKLIICIWRLIKKLFRAIRNSAMRYRPKHFSKKIIAVASCFAVLSPSAVLFVLFFTDDFAAAVVAAIILAAAGVVAVVRYRKNIKNLDRIIDASKRRESVDFDEEKLPEALNILNESLKISNEEVRTAVENAVKNERTKTELITNVSHDLKTPLTSIISYVELLKGCNIENEDAQKYIGIIDEKSGNLKTLIENLIEASKVSAGNVKLNSTTINFRELIIQSVVEFGADFENRNLDLRFNEGCDDVLIFADGQQTYRIIENLLSNAKKYSAPNTRVYASLKDNCEFGIFEIKNTSKAPLDISPEELTERFVRGDMSRGEEEGNGLGLSIAKELCALQGGKLEITIDGDLFKATVYLPKNA